MQHGQNPVDAILVIVFKRGIENAFEEFDVRVPVVTVDCPFDAETDHQVLRETQLGVIERPAKLVEADVIEIEDVRGNEIVAAFLAHEPHAVAEDDDVLVLHFFVTREEIIQALDLRSADPPAINDGIVRREVHPLPFRFFERDRFGGNPHGNLLGVFLGVAGVRGIENKGTHNVVILAHSLSL